MKFKKGDKVRVKKFKERPANWNICGLMDHLMGKVVTVNDTIYECITVYDEINDKEWFIHCCDVEPVNETIVIYRNDNKVIALDKRTGKKAVARCNPEDTFNFETGAKLAFERLTGEDEPKVKEVRRRAEPGEYVKIINAISVPKNDDDIPCYKNGDIIKIINNEDIFNRARFKNGSNKRGENYVLCDDEYVVLEGYKLEEEKVLQGPYNGKIIFTKGDDTFKTGHIYEIKDGKLKEPDGSRYLPTAKGYGGAFYSIDDVRDYFTGTKERKHDFGWSFITLEFIEVIE